MDELLQSSSFNWSEQEKQLLAEQDYDATIADVIDIAIKEIGLGKESVAAIVLRKLEPETITPVFGKTVATIVSGYRRIDRLYTKHTSYETDNFRKLLLTLAEDVRVVLIKIAERLALTHSINSTLNADSDFNAIRPFAQETAVLYAPLAHRLGLYHIKTELEDLSFKMTDYETYKQIAHDLNATKVARDAYIKSFIGPLEEKLRGEGFKFTIKGRTKSIHSIHNKMVKQQCGIENIYDLFAIRVIIDAKPEREKAECWQVYSIVADMYQPNPKRMRDWLTIPKSNGYESLHTTVLGPEGKWVEVQIRTQRMDEIAEKGVAAHWKYKGIAGENGMDSFLKGVRELLESGEGDKETANDFRLDLYDQEVFVFTPKGDLYKLAKGATVLDFAFAVHSEVGCHCIGGIIDGRNVQIRHVLRNGDQVEILTSTQQKPNRGWLDFVKTSKARNKIRQTLKALEHENTAEGRELIERRLKNWKLPYDESKVSKVARKLNYESVSDFYQALASGNEDIFKIRDLYQELLDYSANNSGPAIHSAETFALQETEAPTNGKSSQTPLIIDRALNNVEFRLAKCCNPVFGDDIFGFVSISRGITIHRTSCPNAKDMRNRYGYRVVDAKWKGTNENNTYFTVILRVVGQDDIGIVTNITSVINKEDNVRLRGVNINTNDSLFDGQITIQVSDTKQVNSIIKKVSTIRGVKSVNRI